ncbi:HD domain-containing phosphohydrolase [Pseudomonas sp. EL_65y_Pfl2_R95]|uniref:HD domain-containing phosphohydrolase n=1 Tax=Pseudomonas sp. EL_65y_Pfl2_R95 TaxID=3088698 RepID=UPI0030DD947D
MSSSWTVKLRVLIVCAIVLLVSSVGVFIALGAYQQSAAFIYSKALVTAQQSAKQTAVDFDNLMRPVHASVRRLAISPYLREEGFDNWLKGVPEMVEELRSSQGAVSFFAGDQKGNYFVVADIKRHAINLGSPDPVGANYLVYGVEHPAFGVSRTRFFYLDSQLKQIGPEINRHTAGYDPRQRPWYQEALGRSEMIRTLPYKFFNTGDIGSTVAFDTGFHGIVVGSDIGHDVLDALLVQRRLTPSSQLVLLNSDGQVLASDRPAAFQASLRGAPYVEQLKQPELAALAPMLKQLKTTEGVDFRLDSLEVDGDLWHSELLRLPDAGTAQVFLGISVPSDELIGAARKIRDQIFLQTLLALLLAVPLAAWASGYIAAPITRLTRKVQGIRSFDFSEPIETQSFIKEVRELSGALSQSSITLAHFMDIITRLSAEPDLEKFLPTLLHLTSEASQSKGALLYMQQTPKSPLRIVAGRWLQQPIDLSHVEVDRQLFAVAESMTTEEPVKQDADAQACTTLGLPATATLSVPLLSRDKRIVGVLVLFNDQTLDVSHVEFIRVLSRFAAMALETRGLIEQQKALFESLIHLVATAIDAKSPYTGGHCERVPEAAKILAQAVCDETQGAYADFNMSDADWYALHIGAWLHDCGKVTTPEYVVDKATKLETIYDRIHEIRLRFEVLKRDAQIDYLSSLNQGDDPDQALAQRDAQWAVLDDEFGFVARCNTGSEYMGDDQLQRLHEIAQRRWLRTLDDRLGISGEERVRKDARPIVALPVWENLIADKPEQQVPRPANETFDKDNVYGFNMAVPQFLYDRGELKNLSIRRGTLTEEERYKINEHVIQTIKMLNALPFPVALEQVPEIAGGHHERIDGKGYPCGLTGEQLSPQARIMAIADVFEALTARDRPYKPSKTLSQALHIMRGMCEGGHLDPEIFSIFVRSGACLQYAEQFLHSDQMDADDLAIFLPAQREDSRS